MLVLSPNIIKNKQANKKRWQAVQEESKLFCVFTIQNTFL